MNINNDENSLSKKTKKTKNNNYYSSLDLKNFDKLREFAIFSDSEAINKKDEVKKTKTNSIILRTITDPIKFSTQLYELNSIK